MSSSELEDAGEKVRSLDVATTASIDLIALNNKIVSMRGTVKQVKVQIIHKLTRQIKLLKNKRCSEEQKEKHSRKAQNLGDEVTVIKNLKPDKISKYALGHTTSFEEICKQQKVPTETKALARLAEHKLLQNTVKSFRTDHDDWLSLAAFLQSRNSGRRIKKKRSNKVEKIMTNVKAGEVMVKSFLEKRLEGQPEILEKLEKPLIVTKSVDDLKKDYVSEKPSQNERDETVVYEEGEKMTSDVSKKGKKDTSNVSEKGKKVTSTTCAISEKRGKVTSDTNQKWENVTSDISESGSDVSDNSDLGDNSDSEISISNERPEISKHTTQQKSKQKITSPSSSHDTKEKNNKKQIISEHDESENTETVVRRLNMEEFCKDSTIDVPLFLVSSKCDKSIEKKKKKKDAFFVTSDDSGDDEVSDKDDNVERMNVDESDEEEELSRGKHAFRSTFLGSLSEKDWRKSAQERNKTNHFDKDGAKRGGKFKRDGAKKTGKFDRYGDKRGEKFAQQNTNKYSKGTTKKPEPAFAKSRSNQGPSNKRQDGKRPAPEDFKGKTQEEKLHPSWLASKKRKEQSAIQTFQGKKITFDDD